MTLLDVMKLFSHVREAQGQPNAGMRVEAIQKWGGGAKGDSWCCWLVTMALDLFFIGKSPIPRTGSCQDVLDLCRKNGYMVTTPQVGDLYFYVNDAGHAHHIGVVSQATPLKGIAGNTSEDGTSSNGTGVFDHEIHSTVFARIPQHA